VKTYSIKVSEIKRDWHVIDATDQVLGRLATRVARLLMASTNQYSAGIWMSAIMLLLLTLIRFVLPVIKLSRRSIIDILDILGGLKVSLMTN